MVANQIANVNINFEMKNHENKSLHLPMLMGENGILLGFTGDVWEVSCVRYVLWLQRQNFKLATKGINCALVAPNQPYELNGFFMSIPRTISFPMMADPNRDLYDTLGMEKPGYMLLSQEGEIKGRWYVNETASLSIKSVLYGLR